MVSKVTQLEPSYRLDPNFNAITGLNGSGKSNILDAICFVLGISNLSQVRVENLQELVYKQGQAGVTKASVTIVFNNSNKDQSPTGYEQFDKLTVTRQVVIGGRNKYLINGHNAPVNKVQNLFHSVQLNVNNPHFLIMQGRITKVLNMKPPEILSMIEEAAGTRMFEAKKISTLKTIEKKQKKVDEINRVLQEEITPTLENLRKERGEYMQWASNQNDVERLKRFCVAWEYSRAMQTLETANEDLSSLQSKLDQMEEERVENKNRIEEVKDKIAKMTTKKEAEMSGEFSNLEKDVNQLGNSLVKETASLDHQLDNLQSEEKALQKLEESLQSTKSSIETKQQEMIQSRETLTTKDNQVESLSKRVQELQLQMQAVAAGVAVAASETESTSIAEAIAKAKSDASNSATELKQAELKIKHLTAELKVKRKQKSEQGKELKGMTDQRATIVKRLESVQKQLSSINFDEAQASALFQQKKDLQIEYNKLQEKIKFLQAQVDRLSLHYQDPVKGFDRSRVKGLVATLVRVKDEANVTALEVTAGNKLFNVVVDSEETGKLLLQKGKLKQRVTIIPLNKISRRELQPEVLRSAERLVGRENVSLAKALVEYDENVEPAVGYVFGNTLVCPDLNTAKQVTFDPNIRSKSVTLAGDSFDPQGTLTGGSTPATNKSVLQKIAELAAAKSKLAEVEKSLSAVSSELAALESTRQKHAELSRQEKLTQHELSLLEQRLNDTAQQKFIEGVERMESGLTAAQNSLASLETAKAEAEARVSKLQDEANSFKNNADQRKKQVEKQTKEARSSLKQETASAKQAKQSVGQLQVEIEELEIECQSLEKQIEESRAGLEQSRREVEELRQKVTSHKEHHDRVKTQLDQKRAKIQEKSQEIQTLVKKRDSIAAELSEVELRRKKIQHQIARFNKEHSEARDFVAQLESKYSWIAAEKQFFGNERGDYNFKANDPEKASAELERLQQNQERLSRTINRKVMAMWEKAEQEYEDLKQKRDIIEKDKSKIETAIAELDQKKVEALQITWTKVNTDFGSIFTTLLPGTSAKLELPEGGSLMDGLEFRVAFGQVWKDNLTELSGGQRSLLALALILSLLRFKPAPMYILDEIDAALDLNHTQNIGQMLKLHFKESQFIIVSLKEGMFKNANVLFKTKFVDGVSTVTKTKNSKR